MKKLWNKIPPLGKTALVALVVVIVWPRLRPKAQMIPVVGQYL